MLRKLLRKLPQPVKAYLKSVWCANLGHSWTSHSPGRHCKVCFKTWKTHVAQLERKSREKCCLDCRHYYFCHPYLNPYKMFENNSMDEINPFREECITNKNKHFKLTGEYQHDLDSNNNND